MKKYQNFLFEADDKKNKKEPPPGLKMIFSKKFRGVLENIMSLKSSNISKRLLELENSDQVFDLSYIDVVEGEEDGISYLQSNRAERFKNENKPDEEYWTSKSRVKTKIGRFIKQMFGEKFNEVNIEKFVNKYKTMAKEESEAKFFDIVDKDDIIYWYNHRNYANLLGTMGSSCMSGDEAGRYLGIYSKNPNKCKLLILKNEDEKIKGRALIWMLSEPKDKIFMDRVYTNNDSDVGLFINYARKEGWLYKDQQKYGETDIVEDGKKRDVKMHIVLDDTDFDRYPYVDTLRYYYPKLSTIANHHKFDDECYTLTDTEGYYEEYGDRDYDEDYIPQMVWDGYRNEEISEIDAQWCEPDQAYCNRNDAIRIFNNQYCFPHSKNVVHSDYQNRLYSKKDCVWSKPLNSWILSRYAVDVYHDPDKKSPPDKVHRFELNKTIGNVGEDWFDIDLLDIVDTKKLTKNGKTTTVNTFELKSKDKDF